MSEYITQLQAQGFTVIPAVAPLEKLIDIRQLTEEIVEYSEQHLEDPFDLYYLRHRSDQGVLYDLFQRHPEFQDLAKSSEVMKTLASVLGDDIFLYENSLVYKPPGCANAVPWHQDFISRPNEPKKFIVWIAIDDVSVENGALKAIPGSHKEGYLPWYRVKGETHHDRVQEEFIRGREARYLEMKAGDALIFDAMLLHSSDECHSELPRRAYRISYQGFDAIRPPRGTPVVVYGGRPDSLSKKYSAPRVDKPSWRVFMNKVGKRLARL
ncbi:phytanoyl-CoA dioxygenase family protein [Oceanicoccus sp. KOV_DT_Chl]|uniref:phytanoyl-CoA dioxygenase family protein n=1 Tax=Oceanicoccus sp. KOV_DT_Chl TaxID=1904639 RepID=UPI000C7B6E1C|nr:phytanoyl-CoA dioxygenase family protein [Oceanicoccus sp. KOV_DT_Chl]